MNTVIGLGAKFKESQKFFISNNQISGVQSCNFQYNNALAPLKFLGQNSGCFIQAGTQIGKLSVKNLVISNNIWLQYTGTSGINAYIIEDTLNPGTKNFGCVSGWLTSYNNRCSIGQIPEESVSIDTYHNLGFIQSGESAAVLADFTNIMNGTIGTSPLSIVSYGSISLTLNEFQTNRVNSYNLSIEVPRNPIYCLGTGVPIDVKVNFPVRVNCEFQYEISDYTGLNMRSYPSKTKIQDITLILNDYLTNTPITTFGLNAMTLMSESFNMDVSSNRAVVSASYSKLIT